MEDGGGMACSAILTSEAAEAEAGTGAGGGGLSASSPLAPCGGPVT